MDTVHGPLGQYFPDTLPAHKLGRPGHNTCMAVRVGMQDYILHSCLKADQTPLLSESGKTMVMIGNNAYPVIRYFWNGKDTPFSGCDRLIYVHAEQHGNIISALGKDKFVRFRYRVSVGFHIEGEYLQRPWYSWVSHYTLPTLTQVVFAPRAIGKWETVVQTVHMPRPGVLLLEAPCPKPNSRGFVTADILRSQRFAPASPGVLLDRRPAGRWNMRRRPSNRVIGVNKRA